MDHDRLLKELLTTFFIEFLELFFPELLQYLDRDSVEFLDKEIFTDVTEGGSTKWICSSRLASKVSLRSF